MSAGGGGVVSGARSAGVERGLDPRESLEGGCDSVLVGGLLSGGMNVEGCGRGGEERGVDVQGGGGGGRDSETGAMASRNPQADILKKSAYCGLTYKI